MNLWNYNIKQNKVEYETLQVYYSVLANKNECAKLILKQNELVKKSGHAIFHLIGFKPGFRIRVEFTSIRIWLEKITDFLF